MKDRLTAHGSVIPKLQEPFKNFIIEGFNHHATSS